MCHLAAKRRSPPIITAMDAPERSSRRWITLPAILTAAISALLIGYSAYVVHWARERERFLNYETNGDPYSFAQVFVTRPSAPGHPWPWQLWLLHRLGPERLIGDCSPAEKILFFGEHHSLERRKSRLDRAQRLFPEAEIVEQPMF